MVFDRIIVIIICVELQIPRRRSLFGSTIRSKLSKTLVHSRSSSTSNKENAPPSSCFSSLSSNQTGPLITPKTCRLPLG
ncbi:unnamed protein product [Rotaria socialis]|uniref:Uncharacterized protein n=1 Tax=Rotaria socialis TaxID=392032 RepID=A0A821DNY8_9BILA|nr:unnamed protein product [Rotaria socialis]CAF4624721.1 unnamed protein product [Rotaria socialis]